VNYIIESRRFRYNYADLFIDQRDLSQHESSCQSRTQGDTMILPCPDYR
jgi:hypothetical protein